MKKILCLLVALSFLLAACTPATGSASAAPTSSIAQVQDNTAAIPTNIDDKYTAPQQASTIALAGNTATYNGTDGVSISGGEIKITKAGVYTVSGKLEEGQLIVATAEKGTVTIVLNNAEITNASSAAIWIKQASEAVIALADDTQNILNGGADADTTDENAAKAALFANDNLWLCGNGTLTVNATKGNGIQGKDTVTIANGAYTINAANNGIVGKDSLLLAEGIYTIVSGNDGVKATNANDTALGVITVLAGDYNIKAEGDGFQAQTALNISGGSFEIVTGGGAENAAQKTQNEMFGRGGARGGAGAPPDMGTMPSGGEPSQPNEASALAVTAQATAETAETASLKAFKAGTALNISGGSYNINACDDAFHSNDSLIVTKGQFEVATGDDAFHADNELSILGGSINVTQSYEGIEGTAIAISGGEISIVSSDDGINAAGGDGSGQYGFATDGFSASAGGSLTITAGEVIVNANGDGVDINGSGEMTGGALTVYGPQDGGNGALDYDGDFTVKGGTLISFGSAQMALTPSASGCAIVAVGGSLSAGQAVQFKADSGATAEFTTLKDAQQILFFSADFKSGDTVTVYLNGVSVGETTLSNAVSTVGSVTGTGMGGGRPQKGAR